MWGGICQLLVQTTGDLNEQCNNRKMLLRGVMCTCYDHQAALWPSHGCLVALLISFFHIFLPLQANPGVVTTLDNRMHGFQTGDKVTFKEIVGMTALNGTEHTIKGNWWYWKKYMEIMVELHKVTLAKTILQGTREAEGKSGYTLQDTPDYVTLRLQLAEAVYLLNKMQLKTTKQISSFWRNCVAALVGGGNREIWFYWINYHGERFGKLMFRLLALCLVDLMKG